MVANERTLVNPKSGSLKYTNIENSINIKKPIIENIS